MDSLAGSGVFQSPEEWHNRRQSKQDDKDSIIVARRIMTARLTNCFAWYKRDHVNEINKVGYKKENLLHRLQKMAGSIRNGYTSLEDIPNEIDEEDAIAVYETMKALPNAEHIAILQYRFFDGQTVKGIAEEWGKSKSTVKRLQSDAIDAMILSC